MAIIVIVLKKNGINVLDLLKNGKNGNGNGSIAEIKEQLASLGENHMQHLSDKIDKLTDKEEEGNDISKQILFHMQELRKELNHKHG